MAAKSVIDIDIHDEKFQNFLEKFAEFQKAIGDIPAAWQGIAQGAGAVAQETKKSAETTETIAENTQDAAEATKDLAENTGEVVKAENQLARSRDASGRFIKASADSAAAVAESTTDAADAAKVLADNTDKAVKAEGRLARARAAVGRFFKASAEGAGEVTESTDKSAKAAQKFNKETGKAEKNLNKARKDSKSLATNIKDATSSLLTWGGVLGMFSGLAGVGSLWGLSHLARDAGAQRFTAMGLGTTAGGLNASAVNYQTALGNPVGTLGAIRDAQLDLSKRWQFQAMGVGNPDQDPAKLLPKMIKAARDIFVRNGSTQQGAEAYGLTNFFSLDDLNRFKKMSDAEIDAMAKQADKDAQKLQLTDQQLKQWQEFSVQLDRSKVSIENAFIKGLGPLTPSLEKLSDSVAQAIQSFLESPTLGHWIDDAADAIRRFGTYLSSPEFEQDIDHFMKGVERLAKLLSGDMSISDFLKGSSSILSDKPVTDPKTGKSYVPGGLEDPHVGKFTKDIGRALYRTTGTAPSDYDAYFAEAGKKYHFDPRLLKAIAGAESAWDANANSVKGAQGLMQVMPGNFKPGENPHDPHDNIMAGARVLDWARRMPGGDDVDAMLRWYNGGKNQNNGENRRYAGRVHEAYKKYYGTDMPGTYQSSQPPTSGGTSGMDAKETHRLLQQIVDQHKHGGAQAIVIHNNTGGNAVVSSTQLGGFG